MQPTPTPLPDETDDQFKARACAQLREIAALSMTLARKSAAKALQDEPRDAKRTDPHAAFARAVVSVRQAIALEHRIRSHRDRPAAKPSASPGVPLMNQDRRRVLVREPLHKATAAEPNTATRTQLRRHIDAVIDAHLEAKPEATALAIYKAVCAEIDLHPDPRYLSDEILGLEPPRPPGARPTGTDPPRW